MIGYFLKRSIRRFAARYNYDAGYVEHIADVSTSAALRLSALQAYSQYSGPKEARDVWAGAILASTLEADCGPCVQLVFDMAIAAQVPADQLVLCLQGLSEEAGEVGLGFRFARAAIADTSDLEGLRTEIDRRYGASAVIAVSFAASSGRVYPVLKRGLGFAHTCSNVTFGNEVIRVAHQT